MRGTRNTRLICGWFVPYINHHVHRYEALSYVLYIAAYIPNMYVYM